MKERERFLELLQEAVEMAKTNNETPTEDEVKGWFQGMDLTGEQLNYINAYIKEAVRRKDVSTEDGRNASPSKTTKQNGQASVKRDGYFTGAYLKEMQNVTPLTEGEKVRLYRSLLAGDAGVKSRLVEGNLSKVLAAVKRFRSDLVMEEGLMGEELIGEGNLVLITTIDKMCSNGALVDEGLDDASFYHKCEEYVAGEVKKGLTAYLEMEMGRSNLQKSVVAKSALIYEATNHLAKETGTLANIHELAEYVKMSKEEVMDIVELSNGAIKIGESITNEE